MRRQCYAEACPSSSNVFQNKQYATEQFQNGPPKQKIQRLSKKGSVIAHGVIVLLFDSECIFMSKQTLMEDLFKLITNERRHGFGTRKKLPFLLLSPVVIYPAKFSSTAFSSASHSELNQEFTFVPHDLLKQFACHSSNMGSQSFSLPPCVTYLISSRLLHYCSARTILVDARRPSFLGPNSLAFSAISTIIHELFYENFSPQFAQSHHQKCVHLFKSRTALLFVWLFRAL